MLGKAVTRIASTLAGALLLVFVTVAGGHAQGTTGKIQGRVVSADGRPISSAQVTVEGTNLGNITNDDGFYFINQVPAGLHAIRAQSIGYRSVVVSEQRVLAGQTATVNFTLEQAAVELEALVVTGERNPLVPRDQVSSKAIVTGEKIDALPVDQAASIVLLQPGIVESTCGADGSAGERCVSIRGSRAGEEAVFVDGVPIRNMRNGEAAQVELPTNALAQVDVTTGGISARYGNAQAGVISYVTRGGATTYGGTVSVTTDQIAPKDWRTFFNRGELSFGGPVPGVQNLSFFLGGTFEGQKYRPLNSGFADVPFLIPSGVDKTFRLPRSSEAGGATDSIDVIVPNYVEWNNGRTSPTRQNDEINFTARLSYGLGRGSKIDLSYLGNRDQILSRGHADLYNPDAWTGDFSTENVITASGYFMLHQSAEQALALDVRASWQRDWRQLGTVRSEWLKDHLSPAFGFNVSNIDFVMDPDDWPITDEMINAVRSGALPPNTLQLFPDRSDLTKRQSIAGLSSPLRLNPYGMRSNWNIAGIGNATQQYLTERRWYFSASADWQMNRFNRFWVGGDATLGDTRNFAIPTYSGNTAVPVAHKPQILGLYVQDRLDLGDVVLEAGLRMDHFRPDGQFPRIPGYVFHVPDSLKGDFHTLRPLGPGEVDEGPLGALNRLVPLEDCGGQATAAQRTNALGQVVCKNNFIPAKNRTVFSPKLAVSFPVTATSTFRVSYGQNVQVPALTGTGGLFDFNYRDLTTANINWTYGRDVEIPRTVLFEAGYRQLFGGNTVVDVAIYSKTNRNALTYRRLPYEDPNTGGPLYINSLTNSDYSLTRGVDVRFDRRLSEIADLSLAYSFLDARGTGSDPATYTELLLRRNTNLSVLTGKPVEPPEVLLPLDQSRAHTLTGTFALNFGSDFAEDNRVVNTILSDVGVFATMRVASGLPFTRLLNQGNGQVGPPTSAGLEGQPAEALNSSRTPMERRFDLRLTKSFEVFGRGARMFADLRNPLGFENTNSVFLETGTVTNTRYRDDLFDASLRDPLLDGDNLIDDFNIAEESPENALNKYMLSQAECRFGNCDGIYEVSEQRAALNAWYTIFEGPQTLREKNQSLRLGIEIVF